jgi:hypothetical protein
MLMNNEKLLNVLHLASHKQGTCELLRRQVVRMISMAT